MKRATRELERWIQKRTPQGLIVASVVFSLAIRFILPYGWGRRSLIVLPMLFGAALLGVRRGLVVWLLCAMLSICVDLLDQTSRTDLAQAVVNGILFLGLAVVLVAGFGHDRLASMRQRMLAEEAQLEAERRAIAESAAIAARVTEAQEAERRRLARELHDDVASSLSSVLLGLRALEDRLLHDENRQAARSIREQIRAVLHDVGAIARGLHPSALEELGLAAALETHAREFEARTGVEVQMVIHGDPADAAIPRPVQLAVYRVVQESLTNVIKHAGADRVSVVIERSPASIRAVVEDEGRGFDPDLASRRGLGLQGMAERAKLLGGSLSIESAPGQGTAVQVYLPFTGPVESAARGDWGFASGSAGSPARLADDGRGPGARGRDAG